VKFWSKNAIKYHLPPPRKEKKTVWPRSTHNLLGDITTHKIWSIAEEAVFEKLCIEGNLKEEVYLAAYLACWLCTFILPSKDVNSIRPSTFKMVSMMANGRRVSLAIPILARSYLKTRYPVWQGLHGPKMIIFSSEGGAKYYNPQEARKRIHKAEFVSWACNMIVKNRPFKFVDTGDAEELDHNYFVAICSSYLTLRRGDKFIIEPYSPHRFRRQFGYFQDVPGTLKYDTRVASLEEGLLYASYQSLRQKLGFLLEDDVQSIDASEESKTSHSLTMTPPLGMGKEKSFHILLQCQYLKISNNPVDFLSSIEDDVYLILESMKSFQKFDITKVEESLNTFFVKVRAYD
ncbi:UNVERIFIED_CONTAM: hypothetical protein Sradi_7185900, partial [Sesamum radiatum]